jgi:hypothetical protein
MMARSRFGMRSGSRSWRNSSDHGRERAMAHIAAANRLSSELGGTDKDVKTYFFELPPEALRNVLDEYQHQYGLTKRAYAETTIAKWKSGRVQMSGEVAERLYSLLPPRMPLAVKYRLTEGLWGMSVRRHGEHYGLASMLPSRM